MTTLTLHHWPLERLVEYASNPRQNDAVIDRMVAAIEEFGFRIPIVATSDGTVVDGHLRLKAARKLKLETVPVVLADELTPAQIKAFRLLANQSSMWAEWDDELLKQELEDLIDLDYDLALTGFDALDLERLLEQEDALGLSSLTSQEEAPLVSPERPITQPNDLWILGTHRLLCGDMLHAAQVETLLQGVPADMALTDPPYNVNYGRSLKANWRVKSGKQKRQEIFNDNLKEEFEVFLMRACRTLLKVTKGAVYISMAYTEMPALIKSFQRAGGHYSTSIIWVKNHFALGQADYHNQYEPILYGWKEGHDHYWCGSRTESNVWHIAKAASNPLHPTQKPVALMERALVNSSQKGHIVFDPFGGSGSTLIACEKLNRQCRMIEIDPHYCDVIIKRWQDYSGKQALHGTSGQPFPQGNL